jgi:transcriptional regulator with XRE-family HTH domain
MSLYDRLKKVVSNSGLSLPEFAKKVGLARNTLVRYRDGERPAPWDFLERVCEEFSIDRAWLLLGDDAKKRSTPDMEILEAVISGVEKGLAARRLVLEPEKKARLIGLLYEYYAKTEEMVGQETVERFLRLVA